MHFRMCSEAITRAIVAVLMMGMVALTLLQVTSRYFLESAPPWTEELARLDLVYLTFFGSVLAFQRREHLKVEVVVHALPPAMRKWLGVVIDLASMLVLGVVAWQGIPLLFKFWPLLSAALQWPTTIFYFPVAFCCLVMAIYTALDVVAAIRDTGDRSQGDPAREVSR